MTGTAAGKDGRFFASCGADLVLDFTHCGLPSTSMLERNDLLATYNTLLNRVAATRPDYVIIEIADGIFQRETRMLLESRPSAPVSIISSSQPETAWAPRAACVGSGPTAGRSGP